jgi:hypothetical protein
MAPPQPVQAGQPPGVTRRLPVKALAERAERVRKSHVRLSGSDQRKTLILKSNGEEISRLERLEVPFRRQNCRSKNSIRETAVRLETHFWPEKMRFKAKKRSVPDSMPRQYKYLAWSAPDHEKLRHGGHGGHRGTFTIIRTWPL